LLVLRAEILQMIRKAILIIVLFGIFVAGCNNRSGSDAKYPADMVKNPRSADGKSSEKGMPQITFIEDEHDFGKVIQGEKVTFSFRFKNTGDGDLIIADVSSSCGCTVPKFTKEPLSPGSDGTILVTFDSNNRKGFQSKTVTVVSNTQPNTRVLKIKAMVIVPENM
jgi:hypothetical protein